MQGFFNLAGVSQEGSLGSPYVGMAAWRKEGGKLLGIPTLVARPYTVPKYGRTSAGMNDLAGNIFYQTNSTDVVRMS